MDDKDRYISHHMEDIFDIEDQTTMKPPVVYNPQPNCDHELYNEKDKEIEDQIQAVYDASMQTFYHNAENADNINPKYKARHDEVNIQFLKTALEAAREKASLKNAKEKLEVTAQKNQNSGTTNIIVDRNDLLRIMNKEQEKDITPSTNET